MKNREAKGGIPRLMILQTIIACSTRARGISQSLEGCIFKRVDNSRSIEMTEKKTFRRDSGFIMCFGQAGLQF
jgi:hypothetical protein